MQSLLSVITSQPEPSHQAPATAGSRHCSSRPCFYHSAAPGLQVTSHLASEPDCGSNTRAAWVSAVPVPSPQAQIPQHPVPPWHRKHPSVRSPAEACWGGSRQPSSWAPIRATPPPRGTDASQIPILGHATSSMRWRPGPALFLARLATQTPQLEQICQNHLFSYPELGLK